MSIRYRPPPSLGFRAALGLLGLSAVMLVAAAVQAWRIAPLPNAWPVTDVAAPAARPEASPEPLWAALRAVERDPFHPARQAPAGRFVVLEDEAGGSFAPGTEPPQGPMRLVGTAVAEAGAGGGFAMCQLGGDPPRIVHIGESLGGFTLRSVSRGAAEFTREDGSLVTLTVPGSPARSGGPATSREEVHP